MNKLIAALTIFLIVFFPFNMTKLYAQDDSSTLDLDTESLKNKQKDYSSLTDINGIDLFTDKVQEKVEKVYKEEKEIFNEAKNNLFTNNSVTDLKDNTDNLFQEPVSFNRISNVKNNDNYLIPITIAVTIIIGIIVLIITREFYNRKEKNISEINYNDFRWKKDD